MSRPIIARLTTTTPTLVESLGKTLPLLCGFLRIIDEHPESTALFLRDGKPVDLGPERGVLGLIGPDRYAVHLYCRPISSRGSYQGSPSLSRRRGCASRSKGLSIRACSTRKIHLWNDRLSPVILFNEFELSLPDRDGGYL